MAGGHLPVGLRIAVVQNVGVGVKGAADPVSAKVAHRRVALRRDVILNDAANVLIVVAGLDELTGFDPAIVRGLQQSFRFVVGGSSHKHFAAITVVAIQIDCNVNVDNVAILQFAIVRDSVADYFFDFSKHKAMKCETSWNDERKHQCIHPELQYCFLKTHLR